jgi:hypothetical protein
MIARLALRKIFERVGAVSRETALRVEFSDGSVYQSSAKDAQDKVSVIFRTHRAEWRALLFFYEGLFESFISGDVDLAGEQAICDACATGA